MPKEKPKANALQHFPMDNFGGGLVTKWEANKLDINQSPALQNASFEGRNSIAPRLGRRLVFTGSAGTSHGLYNFLRNDGTEQLVYMYDTKASVIDPITGGESVIDSTITALTDFGVDQYSDGLFYSNGVDKVRHWDGNLAHTPTLFTPKDIAGIDFNGNILRIHERRLYIAGDPAKKHLVRRSNLDEDGSGTNLTDFQSNGTLPATGAGTTNFAMPVTSLQEMESKLYVLKVNGIDTLDYDAVANLIETNPVRRSLGAINHKGTLAVVNSLYFFDSINKDITELAYLQTYLRPTITKPFKLVRPTVRALDFSTCATAYFRDMIIVSCRIPGALTNNVVMVYDTIQNAVSMYTGWNINFFVINNGRLYGCSDVGAKLYELLVGYEDDPGVSVGFAYATPILDFGLPEGFKDTRYVYIEGMINPVDKIYVDIYYDYDSSPITKMIDGSNKYYVQQGPSGAFGINPFGFNQFGGPGIGELSDTNRFRVWISMAGRDFQSVQLVIRHDDKPLPMKITNITPYVAAGGPDHIPSTSKI